MKTDREQQIFEQLITAFKIYGKQNPVYETLVTALSKLDHEGRLTLEFVDDNGTDGSCTMGYFSSYSNSIHIMMYKPYYNTKFLGLLTDWNSINDKSVKHIMKVFLHEMVHYVAYNNTYRYLALWNKKQKVLLKYAFVKLVFNYGELFLPDALLNKKYRTLDDLLNDPKFDKTFESYYAIIRQTDMITLSDFDDVYSKIAYTLYNKCDWAWTRFFDNVFTTCITQLAEHGITDKKTYAIYKSLREAYIILFPGIEKSNTFVSMFYQELFCPSEIACIELSCADVVSSLQPLAIKTLQLA